MLDLIITWLPVLAIITFLAYVAFAGIRIIQSKEYRGSKGREAVLWGVLFLVCAFSLGLLTIKIYLIEGISGIINLGTHILNRR